MTAIRVVLIDDSAVVRRITSRMVEQDPEVKVVGTGANGQLGLKAIEEHDPDIVILDVEMPVMNGLQTLAEIRKKHRALPVIMFSTLTEKGATVTLDALTGGASDYVTKPTSLAATINAADHVRDQLIPKIRALGSRYQGVKKRSSTAPPKFGPGAQRPPGAKGVAGAPPAARPAVIPGQLAPRTPATPSKPQEAKPATPAPPPVGGSSGPIDIVVIGVSTGGPNALAEVFGGFRQALNVPVLIVQHMPALFTKLLAERLSTRSAMPIQEGQSGQALQPGHAWIAPGDWHMEVKKGAVGFELHTHQGPHQHSCRPAVDVLFHTIATHYGNRALAVVLTGMGKDAFEGCQAIKNQGGQVICQDEETSVVWGMPGIVAQSGISDAILPIESIAGEIENRVGASRGSSAQFVSPSRR